MLQFRLRFSLFGQNSKTAFLDNCRSLIKWQTDYILLQFVISLLRLFIYSSVS